MCQFCDLKLFSKTTNTSINCYIYNVQENLKRNQCTMNKYSNRIKNIFAALNKKQYESSSKYNYGKYI